MKKKYLKMFFRYIAWLTMYVNVMISGNMVMRIIDTICFIALILFEYLDIKKIRF